MTRYLDKCYGCNRPKECIFIKLTMLSITICSDCRDIIINVD